MRWRRISNNIRKTHHLPWSKNQSCCFWFSYPHNNSSKTLHSSRRNRQSVSISKSKWGQRHKARYIKGIRSIQKFTLKNKSIVKSIVKWMPACRHILLCVDARVCARFKSDNEDRICNLYEIVSKEQSSITGHLLVHWMRTNEKMKHHTLGLYSALRACKAMALRSNLQSKFTVETIFLERHNVWWSDCMVKRIYFPMIRKHKMVNNIGQ